MKKPNLRWLLVALLGACSVVAATAQSNLTIQKLSELQFLGGGPQSPYGRLVQGTNGDFYGTSYSGGASNKGTVFKVTANGAWTTLFSFAGTNGANPYYGGLMRASDGNFYGNTYAGGAGNQGCIFKITHAGVFSNLFSFRGTNGSSPNGWLAQGPDGNFYGTTLGGGSNNMGTIYKMAPAGSLTPLVLFQGTNGANPRAGLVMAGDGHFYGTTQSGGANDLGAVFRVTTNGVLTLLTSFTGTNGSTLGSSPSAGLTVGSDGFLYGTTETGGPTDSGTLFRISTNGAFSNLFSFGDTNGYDPVAALVEGADGKFYGTTYAGSGVSSNGTAFRISPAGALETLVSFDYTNGPGPIGDLALGSDGNFYGTTLYGGYDGVGAIFRLVAPPVITAITSMNGSVTITWSAFTNGTYQVESKQTINAVGWTALAPTNTASGNTASRTDTPGSSQRYYRVTLFP